MAVSTLSVSLQSKVLDHIRPSQASTAKLSAAKLQAERLQESEELDPSPQQAERGPGVAECGTEPAAGSPLSADDEDGLVPRDMSEGTMETLKTSEDEVVVPAQAAEPEIAASRSEDAQDAQDTQEADGTVQVLEWVRRGHQEVAPLT